MTKQKSIKLALISMLSDPDVEIIELNIQNEDIDVDYVGDIGNGWINRKLIGRIDYHITIYKDNQKG